MGRKVRARPRTRMKLGECGMYRGTRTFTCATLALLMACAAGVQAQGMSLDGAFQRWAGGSASNSYAGADMWSAYGYRPSYQLSYPDYGDGYTSSRLTYGGYGYSQPSYWSSFFNYDPYNVYGGGSSS